MSKYSYQDIETRLQVVEDKINFVMMLFRINKTEGLIDKKVTSKTLLEVYLESKGLGSVAKAIGPLTEPEEEPASPASPAEHD